MAEARPTFTTKRLTLKPLTLGDEDAIEHLLKDPRIARMTTSISFPNPPGATRGFLERVTDPANPDISWAIRLNDTCIGVITLRPGGGLGYWLGPDHWGQGLTTEAGLAIAAYAKACGTPRIHAQHFIDNPASGRVMQKLGMTLKGPGTPMFCPARGETVAQLEYERRHE